MHRFYFTLIILIFIYPISINAFTIDYNLSNGYQKIFNKKILSSNDIKNYQKIFLLQEVCKFKESDKYILKIKENILMGHVLAQRYLHPKCYRSKFIELSSWLKKYNDHPQAKRVYRLAIKRMPEGYKRPQEPKKAEGINNNLINVKDSSEKYKSSKSLNKNMRNKKYQLLSNIKSRVKKGWPTGALKLLNQSSTSDLLDFVEIDQQKELIAKGYFLANKNELAIKYASEALNRSPNYTPFANWTAGLSSWKLEDYKQAAMFFSNFAVALKDDSWHHSSGSFWAARSYGQLNEYKEINFWLKSASQYSDTFYGQLSNRILGTKNLIDWSDEKLDPNTENVFLNLPAGKRIMALIQTGNIIEVEKEILKLNESIDEKVAYISLGIAKSFNFARTQLKIAHKLKKIDKEIPIKYFYPTPNWIPDSDFSVDKSLIFAFIHQESNFNINAKSHKGAVGLMQIMPRTAKFISKDKRIKRGDYSLLRNPKINIEVGQEYINYLLDLEIVNGNLIYLTAAYNGGPGNLSKWLKETNFKDPSIELVSNVTAEPTKNSNEIKMH